MTQEDRKLLLKDLCARLPYGVKCYGCQIKIDGNDIECYGTLKGISNNDFGWKFTLDDRVSLNGRKCYDESYSEVKPYLFPLSSMTEEQWNNSPRANLTNFTFESLKCGCFTLASYTCDNNLHDLIEFVNWLIENHFDIYGLIPKNLALDATGLNIY